ncbi:putative TPD1 protein-like protein 1A [Iris pallida]|uniref:TPD1 protein-like protein 1A n=1 Tax=Iris pallida TaxID=29817 RepID=A0AAX6IK75_IRIPA|nr:putative TPD1 protein-like protein 1A [Iris pallida]KAJ6853177.1 putative TPD1 protein-like protein 1A [Iris pallida]
MGASLQAAACIVLLFLTVVSFCSFGFSPHLFLDGPVGSERSAFSSRRLLQEEGAKRRQPNRIGSSCSKDDIVVYQGATTPLPSGIPTYTVQILNECVEGCSIGRIHLSCGWFSSARLVNPRVFRRLGYNDCLVNDGRPLANGASLSFQYANSFRYPLSVSAASCMN